MRHPAPSHDENGERILKESNWMAEEQQEATAEHGAFAREIDAALAFASDNVYAYGPKWSKRKLVWDVASAEREGEVVRVTLDYRPEGAFKGQPGSEWIEVAADGTVSARNQIRSPREQLPWVLIGIATVAVVAAAVLVPWFLLWGPVEGDDPGAARGRALWMRSSEVDVAPRFYFTGLNVAGETHSWIIVPEEEGNELALVRVELHNDSSATAHVLIDEEAARLESADYVRYSPIDPLVRILALAEGEEMEAEYTRTDFIPVWGSVDIGTDEALIGMMIFEVRAGSTFTTFRWLATNHMTRHY